MQYIFLQAASGGRFFSDPLNMVLISATMFVLYFFMLRPNQRKAKEGKEFFENLAKGDKVITAGGIHGKVLKINESTIEIEISNNNPMTVEKNFISTELSMALKKASTEEKK